MKPEAYNRFFQQKPLSLVDFSEKKKIPLFLTPTSTQIFYLFLSALYSL
jgi:hypothetical protein